MDNIENDNKLFQLGVQIIDQRSLTKELTWDQAALILGEDLSTVGPTGYYEFNPDEWLQYARKRLKAIKIGRTLRRNSKK